MTQDHITRFNIHTAGKFSSQDADALQPLLLKADDDAFPELMAVRISKRTLLNTTLYILLIASIAHLFFSPTTSKPLTIAAYAVALISLCLILFLPPYKKRTYRIYSSILRRHTP